MAVDELGPFNLLRPLLLMSYSLYYLPITIFDLITTAQFSTLLQIEALKSAWFARFWAWFGPRARDMAAPNVVPLLQNNARGVCLDIGPGSGQWLYVFAKAMNPDITKIYGVEPNKGLHAELRANADRAGLGDVYEIIGCGAEELTSKGGIDKGSIDTIITVQCLCSIPHPERIIKELYPLLKPGGVWLVYEHIKTKFQNHFVGPWQRECIRDVRRSMLMMSQGACNLVWPHCIGGCQLTRTTDEWLLQAGEWAKVDLSLGDAEGPYAVLPHTAGTLTKA